MKAVGLRELKNRLSEYVRHVRAGEGVLVTDRGEVVAQLGPPGQGTHDASVPAGLSDLIRRGELRAAIQPSGAAYPLLAPALRPGRSAELLSEERAMR